MRDVDHLIEAIDEAVRSSEDRRRSRDAMLATAQRIATALPWTHRTGRPGKGDWRAVFRDRRLEATPVGTTFERALGLRRAVYFFVGSCAYPEGLAVLLFFFDPDSIRESTFNPYDTGSLKKIASPRDSRVEWNGHAKLCHLASTIGWAKELPSFAGHYIAAHFRDPWDYVRRPQSSNADFEQYHGLAGGDRRGWTIETRIHHDVSFEPAGRDRIEIWLEDQDLLEELPRDLRQCARVRKEDMTLAETVAWRIEQRVLEMAA